jgi:aminoglycoside phosphotransferase (APT) family kinase protein
VLDQSKRIVPYDYLVTSKLPGSTVVDAWPNLTEQQRENIAYWSGKYLAMIHSHSCTGFGKLRDLVQGGFPGWFEYLHDYFRRYARQGLDLGAPDMSTVERVEVALAKYRPLLAGVRTASLVHSDYHFENILTAGGKVSGIIDFEWAFAGDPALDFVVEDKWDKMCPGSAPLLYKGYLSERDLNPDHGLKVGIYKMVGHVESIVDSARAGDTARCERFKELMLAELAKL